MMMTYDASDMELLRGQNHYWWFYSNKRDRYFETDIRTSQLSGEAVICLARKGVSGSGWIDAYDV